MTVALQWTCDITVDELDGATQARIGMHGPDGTGYVGIGLVHHEPLGGRLAPVAKDLAVARALSDLTEELLEAVAADIHSRDMYHDFDELRLGGPR